jgi:hypothetical protein
MELAKDQNMTRHSRRSVPISRSAYAFCQGDRGRDRSISNSHPPHSSREGLPVGTIIIPDQIAKHGASLPSDRCVLILL